MHHPALYILQFTHTYTLGGFPGNLYFNVTILCHKSDWKYAVEFYKFMFQFDIGHAVNFPYPLSLFETDFHG